MNQTKNVSGAILYGLLLPAVLIAAGVGAYVTLGRQQPKQAPVEGMDTVSKLRRLPIVAVDKVADSSSLETLDVSVTGTVVSYRQINLAAEVAGRVRLKSDSCQIGRFVKRGDLLFQLDPTDFELEVERLDALQESEYAQQRELDQEISNSKDLLELAEEELSILEKDIARLQALPKGFASESELDQAKRSRVASANQRLTILNQIQTLETRRSRLKMAERLAASQLQQARVNLERTKIVSPIDGVIVTESVQTDSYVQKGATLCVIEDTEKVEVSCNLRSDQLLLILDQPIEGHKSPKVGALLSAANYELPHTEVTVSYRIAGREGDVFEWKGKLSRYEGIGLDTQSRTVPVRIQVEKPNEVYINGEKLEGATESGLPALVRGMFVQCQIHTVPPKNVVLIPKLALKPGNQLWKFEQDDSLVAPEAPSEEPVKSQSDDQEAGSAASAKSTPVSIDPKDWRAGKVLVTGGINVVNLIKWGTDNAEFWVVEGGQKLKPNDLVIVSPLANIVGDGTDAVRYQIKSSIDSSTSDSSSVLTEKTSPEKKD
ncbi:MAG: HlyD family efflux transporter periplasmic adaptor subunit [Pirellula sp.]|nr:HlyD family efflux transporter periplasmic adaptor subunit [Pirellula sp.]